MLGLTEFYLDKSGSWSLFICLLTARSDYKNTIHLPVLNLLFRHHHRWILVDFDLPMHSFPDMPASLPMLRHFSLNSQTRGFRRPSAFSYPPHSPIASPDLTYLKLWGIERQLVQRMSNLGKLVQLSLISPDNPPYHSIDNILNILQQCSSTLVYLRLQGPFTELEVTPSRSIIVMNHVEEADLDRAAIHFLPYLRLPHLSAFTANACLEVFPTATLLQFLKVCNPPLQHLTFHQVDMEYEPLMEILTTFPSLIELDFWLYGPRLTLFATPLLKRLSLTSCRSCEDILLPNLTHLEMGFEDDIEDSSSFDGTLFVETISSRFYLGRNPGLQPPCSPRCSKSSSTPGGSGDRCRVKPLERLGLNGGRQQFSEEAHDMLARMKEDGLELETLWRDDDTDGSEPPDDDSESTRIV
ncbi:hypothetical protein PM082_007812 [Marasmius tenuissimus]|nr:hypothetical protein PM082_007812 [Marasmius tenuissimus]